MSDLNSSAIRRCLFVDSEDSEDNEESDEINSVVEARIVEESRSLPDSDVAAHSVLGDRPSFGKFAEEVPARQVDEDIPDSDIDLLNEELGDDPPASEDSGLVTRRLRQTKIKDDIDIDDLYDEGEYFSDTSSLFSDHSSDDYHPTERELKAVGKSSSDDSDSVPSKKQIQKKKLKRHVLSDDIDFEMGRPVCTSTPAHKRKRGRPKGTGKPKPLFDINRPSTSTAMPVPVWDSDEVMSLELSIHKKPPYLPPQQLTAPPDKPRPEFGLFSVIFFLFSPVGFFQFA